MKNIELCQDEIPVRLRNNTFFILEVPESFLVRAINVWFNLNADVLKHLHVYHLHLPRHVIE